MYNTFWRHALFVSGQLFSVKTFDRSRNGWQVNGEGAGNDFRGLLCKLSPPSPLACLLLAHPLFLVPTTSKSLLRRLSKDWNPHHTPLSTINNYEIIAGHAQELSPNPSGPSCSKAVNVVGVKVYFGFLILLIKSILSDSFLYYF